MIQVLDKQFNLFIEAGKIQSRINELAEKINTDYKDQSVTFVVILNGAFMFASDLFKRININCEITFVKIKSYEGMESKGKTSEVLGLTESLCGKNVIVVEDIVDSGLTIETIKKIVLKEECQSVKIATLLFKPTAFKGNEAPQYVGFEIENKFVVGYGLDYDEQGRNLDAIYQLKN